MEFYIPYTIAVICIVSGATYYFVKRKAEKDCNAKYILLKNEVENKTSEIERILHKQSRFWSVITHELKNVFYSFYNSIDLLNTEYNMLSEDERKMLANNIGNSYNYTLNVINDLMEWSKVNRQLQKPSFESFNLRVLTDEIVLNYNDKLSTKEIAAVKNLSDNLYVYSDRMMIGYIVKNVLNNAVKFSNKGGTIKIFSAIKGSEVFLYIEDNGVGIPKENLERLFNLDEIFSTYGTNREKGTGLGLLICKDFIELNNGKINVESEEGKYTRVILSLPADNS